MATTRASLRAGWSRLRAAARDARDRQVGVIAAGVAFYAFLAVPPALAALASLYGLVADPDDIERQVTDASGALSPETRRFLVDRLRAFGDVDPAGLGIAAVAALLLALWSASSGTALLVRGVRIAAGRPTRAGFVRRRLVGLALTLGAMALLVAVVLLVTLLPALLSRWGLAGATRASIHWLRWPVVLLVTTVALGVVYDVALGGRGRRLRPAPATAAALWFVASIALAVYSSNFHSFERTYGPLSSIAAAMVWLYAGALAALFGAVLEGGGASDRSR
jgi:membrane protein